ncbi:type II toxin-antitoxin system RelE/ParE family toxin [Luteimonas sp. SDU82]|uniref:type II toxin-antitoxin system RelE/ParE family toxin n=1 Tax=Luteimonas sp. SDU82 TaxID=3422592 RepID=UPI003EB6F8FC
MSQAPRLADARAEPRIERLQSWIAALLSVLLHLACLLLALLAPPITTSTPQGASGGSVTLVDFIGETPPQPLPTRAAPASPERASPAPPAASRLQSTPVPLAEAPVPPVASDPAQAQRPSPSPAQPSAAPRPQAAVAPPSAPSPASRRPQHRWGQPPGMLPRETAPVHAGPTSGPDNDRSRRRDSPSAQPSMEVGGYQVYYDLASERRLREWRDQGMTEVFIPLPGTRDYMICPLETALRRESGPCRLLPPDAPELEAIGDARQVITMHQVYRRGELVWRGPRPYR